MSSLSLQDPFYQAILNSANLTIIATQPDGIITYINPYALDLLEYSAEELLHIQTPGIFHDPQEIQEHAHTLSQQLGYTIEVGFEAFIALAKLDQPDENDWTYITRSGQRIPIHLSVTAIYDAEKKLIGFLGVGKDITELKKSQAKEQELSSRFQQLAEAAFEAIVLTEHGIITDVNHEFERLFKCQRSNTIGLHIMDFVAPESKELVKNKITGSYADIYEAKALTTEGNEVYTEVCGKAKPLMVAEFELPLSGIFQNVNSLNNRSKTSKVL